jgi:hypothetical protein
LEEKRFRTKRNWQNSEGLIRILLGFETSEKPSIHVPYNMLTFWLKWRRKGKEIEFIAEKLQSYGYLSKGSAAQTKT